MTEIDISGLDEHVLAAFVTAQRWYGSKSREVAGASIIEVVPLRSEDPHCAIALVEVRFQPGTHETYQVLLGLRPSAEPRMGPEIDRVGDWTVYEGLGDPLLTRELVALMAAGAAKMGAEGSV